NKKIPAERIEDMLPGTHRIRRSDERRPARGMGPEDIVHQTVVGPIAAADDIACAHRRNAASGLEKGTTIGRNDELGGALAAAVGVMSAHRVAFTISPGPFVIFLAFVAGYADDGLHAPGAAA